MHKSVESGSDWQEVLLRDEILANVIQRFPAIVDAPHEDIYASLLHSIIGQQLSTKVARVIRNRFLALFPDNYPVPAAVLLKTEEELRSVGLSFQKIKYIKNVAAFANAGELTYTQLVTLNDENLIKHLTQIKGVGRWTAEMILMFTLVRPDVLPLGDLGIQNSIKKLYNLTQTGKELDKQILTISEPWRPHRTLACRYLWLSLDNS